MSDSTRYATQPSFLKNYHKLRADIRIVSGGDEFLSTTGSGKKFRGAAWFRLIIQTIISLIILAAGLYILMSREFDENTKKIGSGFIGTVVGYWLA